jgi:formylmethanofuran dehydrogenase subunit B
VKELVCDGCSLLCDDVKAEYENNELKSLGLCRLGHEYLETALKRTDSMPSIRRDDEVVSVSLDEAIAAAIDILRTAKHPLVYGWTRSTNEAVSKGIDLATSLGAFFDTQASLGVIHALSSDPHVMGLDYTLDDARNYGEVVVYWGSNPTESSHRHISRFSVLPKGQNVPEGVESRAVIVVDVRETETMKIANHRLVIPFGSDVEVIRAMIGELSGRASIVEEVCGIPPVEMISLTNKLKNSDGTVFFYGSGLFASGHASENLMALRELIETIRNGGGSAHALPMVSETNTMGALHTLVQSSGFSSAVDFSSGSAKRGEQHTMTSLLSNGEFDAALVAGSDILATLPGDIAKRLTDLPLVYVGPSDGLTPSKAAVFIPTGSNMALSAETMHRIDQESVQLIPFRKDGNGQVTELTVLSKMHSTLQARD